MPMYAFRCHECGAEFDERRSFARSEDPARCPVCQVGNGQKVLSAPVFFSSGVAARALLDGAPEGRAGQVSSPAHGSGCPCCGPVSRRSG